MAEGGSNDFKLPKHRCKRCRGTGLIPGVKKTLNMGKGMGSMPGPCPDCDGVGWLEDKPIDPQPNRNIY